MFLNTRIISHHNILDAESFKLFSGDETDLKISNVQEDSFTLSIESLEGESEDVFLGRAHSIFSYYLVAINLATLGHFSWDFQLISPVPYFKSNEITDAGELVLLHKKTSYKDDDELRNVNSELVWRSLKIMIALGNERDDVFISEYIKGIYHIHNEFLTINFRNEAFSNFYKAFEYFCTSRILKVKSLNNEKKQLKSVLTDFGFSKEATVGFDDIYVARCNDIMHAQKGITEGVELGLITRLKIYLDSLLHRHYESLWMSDEKTDN